MSNRARVRLPDPAEDRPRAHTLAIAVVGGLLLGVAVAFAAQPRRAAPPKTAEPSARPESADSADAGVEVSVQEPRLKPRPRAVAAGELGPTTAEVADAGSQAAAPASADEAVDASTEATETGALALAADVTSAVDAGVALDEGTDTSTNTDTSTDAWTTAQSVPDASVEVLPPTATTLRARDEERSRPVKLSLTPGIIAYIRCDGLKPHDSQELCPRDRKFEMRVWRALRRLESCSEADPGRGEGEVRFEYARARLLSLEVRAHDGTIDRAAVEKCAGRKLSRLRNKLRALRLLVSFRFDLR